MSETKPEQAGWEGSRRVPMLLADLIDSVNMMRWENMASRTPRGTAKPRKPHPVPRPGVTRKGTDRHVGAKPIPVGDFDAWWKARIRDHAQGGTRTTLRPDTT